MGIPNPSKSLRLEADMIVDIEKIAKREGEPFSVRMRKLLRMGIKLYWLIETNFDMNEITINEESSQDRLCIEKNTKKYNGK